MVFVEAVIKPISSPVHLVDLIVILVRDHIFIVILHLLEESFIEFIGVFKQFHIPGVAVEVIPCWTYSEWMI